MPGIIIYHLLHTLLSDCDTKSAAADRKKNAKLILSLICSPFVNQIPQFTWLNIDCFLLWYLHGSFSNFYSNIYNIKLIIDMYTCTCIIGRQK